MQEGKNKRLTNLRTKSETGLDYVMSQLSIETPFGRQQLKELKPCYPGDEALLIAEYDRMDKLIQLANNKPKAVSQLKEAFMMIKDVRGSVARCKENTLSVVELFELKSFLLTTREIRRISIGSKVELPEELIVKDTDQVLDLLDPRKDRINTFYIYDDFSEALASMREGKRVLEKELRKHQKRLKAEIKDEYGIELTPKFDIVIPKSSEKLEIARNIGLLEQIEEDYNSVIFKLVNDEVAFDFAQQLAQMDLQIDQLELEIQQELSRKIWEHADVILDNCQIVGKLDLTLAKALYGLKNNCIRPEIVCEHVIDIVEGRQLQVESILRSKGKSYTPVSIKLEEGVTCITGANMGGKTISLKLSGLIPLMAQYGFLVPCKQAKIGLSSFVQILIGDSQSVERGLSSFGSEMEELKEILDNSKARALILIDEIASGTNPIEGLALTKSLVDYLKEKPYISLITTHFDAVAENPHVVNMQVRGLADVDFSKLDSQLRYANRKERINIIGRYMDYRLIRVDEERQIPKDALNIAKMLGIDKAIIQRAQEYIK